MRFFHYKKRIISYGMISMVFFGMGFALSSHMQRRETRVVLFPSEKENAFFSQVAKILKDKYPFSEPSDKEKLFGSIKGLVKSYGDEYTIFFSPKNAKVFKQDVQGSFGGVGMEIGIRDGFLAVISPLKGSPAEKAGLVPGDIILKINHEELGDETIYDVLDRIRGKIGTKVVFTILRPGEDETKDIEVTRELIHVPTIDTREVNDTFVISLYNFSDEALPLFKKALETYVASGKDNLLIDLRGNPGGLLEAAVDMLSYFIDQGKIIVREDYGDNTEGKAEEERSKGYLLLKHNSPKNIGVVINQGSASASEIFAGALQDYGKVVVLGERSFGKGSVQELIPFDNETSLKVTVAKWLTPKGRQISQNGIDPDFPIENVSSLSTEELVSRFEKIIAHLDSEKHLKK